MSLQIDGRTLQQGSTRDMLFGVTETDPVTLVGVGLLVPAIALLAAIVPTRRALAIDPVRAIRAE